MEERSEIRDLVKLIFAFKTEKDVWPFKALRAFFSSPSALPRAKAQACKPGLVSREGNAREQATMSSGKSKRKSARPEIELSGNPKKGRERGLELMEE
jgi:hypothetical protein